MPSGGLKLLSPLKIGGVPPLAGRGYEMKLGVYSYIVAKRLKMVYEVRQMATLIYLSFYPYS
jgi:hypothetical protein